MSRHGMTGCRLHRIWKGMRTRVFNTKSQDHKWYDGKGFYEEWNDFSRFYEWAVNNGYADNLTIDRIYNSRGYFPNNCRWITNEAQASNRTTNHRVEIDGRTFRTLKEASEAYGLKRNVASARIFMLGWSIERALKTPVEKEKQKHV